MKKLILNIVLRPAFALIIGLLISHVAQ